MPFKFHILFITSLLFAGLLSCKERTDQEIEKEVNTQSQKEIVITDTTRDEKLIESEMLPFFKENILDEDFKSFYYSLIKNCQNQDTTAVLKAISDTLRFSKYECAYGQFINGNDCDGCIRCTKKGMLGGVFSGSNTIEICSQLKKLITQFGIGPFKDNQSFYKWMKIENAYVNFYFSEPKWSSKYFNYELIIPLEDGITVKKQPNNNSETIQNLRYELIEYINEPGMGEWDEENKIQWIELNGGFINGSKVVNGFDYTLVIFEKTKSGWKITGFIQPSGC